MLEKQGERQGMSQSEKSWVYRFSLVMLLITSIPYAAGYWLQGSNWQFTGFFIGVEDGNSYLAKMLIGSAGEWLFRTPYTAYPQTGFLAFLPYLLLGKLAAAPGLHDQLAVLFQGFRWAGGFLMILATYQWLAFFVEYPRLRRLGTALGVAGGGLGWLAFAGLQPVWGERIPLEMYSPETFGFLSLFTLPHLALGRALLLWGLLAYWQGYRAAVSRRRMLGNGMLWLGLGLMQPLTVLIGWMLLGLDLMVRFVLFRMGRKQNIQWKMGLVNGAVMVACSAPLVAYTAFSFLSDPFLKIWSQQNIILSPPPIDYFLAYGLILPFLFFGARRVWHEGRPEGLVLIAWVLLLPVLAYFPYNLQRRLPEGLWLALLAIAMVGLGLLRPRWARAGRWLLISSFVMTVVLFAGSLMSVFQVRSPVYRPVDEVNAFQYLSALPARFPVVLAAYDTSNALPAWAPAHTLIGHGPESIHLKEIQPRVEAFFQSETAATVRTALINEFHIQYVVWGPAERDMGSWDPAESPQLTRIYQNTTYQIFEVK